MAWNGNASYFHGSTFKCVTLGLKGARNIEMLYLFALTETLGVNSTSTGNGNSVSKVMDKSIFKTKYHSFQAGRMS